MDRAEIAAEARWLLKPNFSREGLSLEEAAKHVGLTPAELDLLLWETNGGLTQAQKYQADRRERLREEREKYRVTTRKPAEAPARPQEREERQAAHRDERGHPVTYDPKRADRVLRVFA